MSLAIKFNDNYPKLCGQKDAILVKVERTKVYNLPEVFVDYDTKKSDGEHYRLLPHQNILVLYFVGNKQILFTSIRKDVPDNEHYLDEINRLFKIDIELGERIEG